MAFLIIVVNLKMNQWVYLSVGSWIKTSFLIALSLQELLPSSLDIFDKSKLTSCTFYDF